MVAGEPLGAIRNINGAVLSSILSLVERHVAPWLFGSSVRVQTEVRNVLTATIKILPASQTLKYTNVRKRYNMVEPGDSIISLFFSPDTHMTKDRDVF